MSTPAARAATVAAVAGWVSVAACLVTILLFDARLRDVGRADLVERTALAVFVLPVASAATVGAVLISRRPGHPVGWLFLALGFAVAGSGVVNSYAAYGAVARPGSLPGAELAAVVGDAAFIPWIMLLALILLLTPTGRFSDPRWRLAGIVAIASASLSFGLALVRPYRVEYAALGIIENPAELATLQGPLGLMAPAGARRSPSRPRRPRLDGHVVQAEQP